VRSVSLKLSWLAISPKLAFPLAGNGHLVIACRLPVKSGVANPSQVGKSTGVIAARARVWVSAKPRGPAMGKLGPVVSTVLTPTVNGRRLGTSGQTIAG
jgi:hypothetical protein